MKPMMETIQGIDTLSVRGEGNTTGVIILHGYGANFRDLFPLWEMWNLEGLDWYFPNGVLPLPSAYYEGRSWFSIDIERLERAIREGTHRQMGDTIPPEFDETMKKLEVFASDVATRYKQIIVGGFSQGAMCSSHLALKTSLPVQGLILLSGNLVAAEKFPANAKGIPFYQSHGAQDPILSIDGAKDLEKKLVGLGLTGKLEAFQGGHEIPPQVIKGVGEFLKRVRG
jgi:phospholipase/carboxylesterase